MLKKIRITLAFLFWLSITWLLLDFTGTAHVYLGWMAKIQFMPAFLSLNVGALLLLFALTLLYGRIYCSIICPLGVMQDVIAWFRKKKNKYSYSPEKSDLRKFALFFVSVGMFFNSGWLASLIFPYSTYGRMVSAVLAPLYKLANNGLAQWCASMDSYAMYGVEVWFKSLIVLLLTLLVWGIIVYLAWRGGRTWCNTICPVGTLLGFVSKYSLYRPNVDEQKCNSCGLCERNCKASCINSKTHTIDMSRCVMCGNCLDICKKKALSLTHNIKKQSDEACVNSSTRKECRTDEAPTQGKTPDMGRRAVLASTVMLSGFSFLHAQNKNPKDKGQSLHKTTDGGLAPITPKTPSKRMHMIVPPGAQSVHNLKANCIACQLCINACPNEVLRPSQNLATLMQPEVSFERGYCRPECNRCSQVCPTGAIQPITVEARTAVQVGHAVWNKELCIVSSEHKLCGNCARRCSAQAIQLVPVSNQYKQEHGRWIGPDGKAIDARSVPMIPVINEEKCIGCGACENLCPVSPQSAIHVEGHDVHREV